MRENLTRLRYYLLGYFFSMLCQCNLFAQIKMTQAPTDSAVSEQAKVFDEKKIDETIAYLKDTALELSNDYKEVKHDLLEKVNFIIFKKAKILTYQEDELYNKNWELYKNQEKSAEEPKQDHRKSDKEWKNIIANTDLITESYPELMNDTVIYQKALAYTYLGNSKKALASYKEIVEKYPTSEIVPEALFEIAEMYFDSGLYHEATAYYQRSVEAKEFSQKDWAYLKLGWCYYNLSQYEASGKMWKKAIEVTVENEAKDPDKSKKMKDEILKNMAYVFVELSDPKQAIEFYQKFQKDSADASLLFLTSLYLDRKKQKEAAEIFNVVLSKDKSSQDIFDGLLRVLAVYFDGGLYQELWKSEAYLIKNYGPKSSFYKNKNPQEQKVIFDKIKGLVLNYPKKIHLLYQKQKTAELLDAAQYGYQLFLAAFAEEKEKIAVLSYLAAIQFEQKKYELAGDAYRKIAILDQDAVIYNEELKKYENIKKQSALDMIKSYAEAAAGDFKILADKKPDFKAKSEILPPLLKKFVTACELFTDWFPDEKKEIRKCDFFMADIYFSLGYKKEGLKFQRKIIFDYDDVKAGEAAIKNVLFMLADQKEETKKFLKEIEKTPVYAKSDLSVALTKITRNLAMADITDEKDPLKRAQLYAKYAKEHPQDENADALWNNAAVEFLNLSMFAEAMDCLENLVKKYKNSKLREAGFLQLAKIKENLMLLEHASRDYFAFTQAYPLSDKSPQALMRACQLAIAGEQEDAAPICQQIKDPATLQFLIKQLALNYLDKNQWKKLDQLIGFAQKRDNSLYVNLYYQKWLYYQNKLIHNHDKEDSKHAEKIAIILQNNLSKLGTLSAEASRESSEILLKISGPAMAAVDKLQLAGGQVDQLQKSLMQYYEALGKLEASLAPILNLKDPYWTMVCFYKVAHSYSIFAKKLLNPPKIKGASAKLVKQQLAPTAKQISDKAKEYRILAKKVKKEYKFKYLKQTDDGIKDKLLILSPDFLSTTMRTASQ